jgi:hypothetical protein
MPLSKEWTDIRAALEAPFHSTDVQWRLGLSGDKDGKPWARCFPHIDSRAVQRRLDDVLGQPFWKTEFQTHGLDRLRIVCTLSVLVDGEWVSKADGATEMGQTSTEPDEQTAWKGGLSQALKRAAVHWGVGRYLYDLDVQWAECDKRYRKNWNKGWVWKNRQTKEGYAIWWIPPRLPRWALPASEPRPEEAEGAVDKIRWILAKEVGCTSPEEAERVLRHINPECGLAELKDPTLRTDGARPSDVLRVLNELRDNGTLNQLLSEASEATE